MSYKVKGNKVKFNCPNPKCGVRLTTKLSQAGTVDTCPECRCKFRCAGEAEYDAHLETKRQRAIDRTAFVDDLLGWIVVTIGGVLAIGLGLAFMIFCIWVCRPSGGSGYSSYNSGRGYNESIPAGMSRGESNYIGNTAIENGMSEEEAIILRDAINKFSNAK